MLRPFFHLLSTGGSNWAMLTNKNAALVMKTSRRTGFNQNTTTQDPAGHPSPRCHDLRLGRRH